MILIDDPYLSRALLDYIKNSSTDAVLLNKPAAGIHDVDPEDFLTGETAAEIIKSNPKRKLITVSENSLHWLEKHHPDQQLLDNVKLFKDKYETRKLLRDLEPELYFESASVHKLLEDEKFKPKKYPVIAKPRAGFFSIGVERINDDNEWEIYRRKLNGTEDRESELFPASVLNRSEIIFEELINGTEIACDAFFAENGRPVILGIYQHDFASELDMSDRLYRISADIIRKFYDRIMTYLDHIADKLMLKSFPLHIELRIDDDGLARLIEINPLRFGGWCTTADVNEFAFNMNSYHSYFHDITVSKDELLSAISGRELALIILDKRGKCLHTDENIMDIETFARRFRTVYDIRPVDAARFPLFGFVIAGVSSSDDISRQDILMTDLSEYCRK